MAVSDRTEERELSANVRVGTIETLELLASRDKQRDYQSRAPFVDVPAELFCQWEECYLPADAAFHRAFDEQSLAALRRFHLVFDEVCQATPDALPPLEEFMRSEHWSRLAEAAREALVVLCA